MGFASETDGSLLLAYKCFLTCRSHMFSEGVEDELRFYFGIRKTYPHRTLPLLCGGCVI